MPRSLNPLEEIQLRRVAHGPAMIEASIAARLRAFALVEQGRDGLRLTPLGRRSLDALPQTPLLMRRGEVPDIESVIASVLERAARRLRKIGDAGTTVSSGGPPHS